MVIFVWSFLPITHDDKHEVCFYLRSRRVEVARSTRALEVPGRRAEVVLLDYHIISWIGCWWCSSWSWLNWIEVMMMIMTNHLWWTNGPGSRMLRQRWQLGTLVNIIIIIIIIIIIFIFIHLFAFLSQFTHFCRKIFNRNFRTFSADFLKLKSWIYRLYRF